MSSEDSSSSYKTSGEKLLRKTPRSWENYNDSGSNELSSEKSAKSYKYTGEKLKQEKVKWKEH